MLKPYFYMFVERFLYIDLCNHRSSVHLPEDFPNISAQAMQTQTALCYFPISRPILLRRRSEKCIIQGSKYAHWIRLYLSFHLNWVLGPFVHGRLQNLKTSEDTFGHDITPLRILVTESSDWLLARTLPLLRIKHRWIIGGRL